VKHLKCDILVSVVAILAAAMSSVVAGPTTRPTTQPSKASPPAPKMYRSLQSLLAQIPRELTKGSEGKLSPAQEYAVNQWLGGNVPPGSMLAMTGKFAGSSGGRKGVSITFRYGSASIHGKKVGLRVTADIDGKFADKVARFKAGKRSRYADVARTRHITVKRSGGTTVAVHGKIAILSLSGGELRVRLRYGGLGGIPSSAYRTAKPRPTSAPTTRPKPASAPTTRPKPTSAAKDSIVRALRKLRLAKTYLGFGKKDKAIAILKGVVADYPGTVAAKAAADKLKQLRK
jgi:hypothetical protein